MTDRELLELRRKKRGKYVLGMDESIGERKTIGELDSPDYAGVDEEVFSMPEEKETYSNKYVDDDLKKMAAEDAVGPKKEDTSGKDAASAGAMAAAKGGSASDIASAAAMASGNPVAIGGALALKTIQSNKDAEYQEDLAEYKADTLRKDKEMDALQKLIEVSQRMRML
jgi:hypothetical protein